MAEKQDGSQPGNIPQLPKTGWTNNDLRLGWAEWCHPQVAQWSSITFVSLNFKSSLWSNAGQLVHLDEQIARNEVRKFGNRVDRVAYGNSVRRHDKRVCRIPFLEHGQDRGWHCHLVMEKPPGMADVRFGEILRDAWTQSGVVRRASGYPRSRRIIAGYATKYRSKSEMEAWSDTIIVEAVAVRTK